MGNSFKTTGTIRKASTGRSLVIELVNLYGKHYVGIKDIEDLIADRKKSVTVFIPVKNPYKPTYR